MTQMKGPSTIRSSAFLLLTVGPFLASCAVPTAPSTSGFAASAQSALPIDCNAAAVHGYFVALEQHYADLPASQAEVREHEQRLQQGAIANLRRSPYTSSTDGAFFGENIVLEDAEQASQRHEYEKAQPLLQNAYCAFLAYDADAQALQRYARSFQPKPTPSANPVTDDGATTMRKLETYKLANLIAVNMIRLGKPEPAERLLRALLTVPAPNPTYGNPQIDAERSLAFALLVQGKTAEGKRLLMKAISADAHLDEPAFKEVVAYEKQKYGQALDASTLTPSDRTANDMIILATENEIEGNQTEAEFNWDAVTVGKLQNTFSPSAMAVAYNDLAWSRFRQGQFQEAIRLEEGAIQLTQQVGLPPDGTPNINLRVSLLLKLADLNIKYATDSVILSAEEKRRVLDAASGALARAATRDGTGAATAGPVSAELMLQQGRLAAARGDNAGAERDLLTASNMAQQVFANDPDSLSSYYDALANFYITRGNVAAARSALQKQEAAEDALNRNPDNTYIRPAVLLNAAAADLLEQRAQNALVKVRRLSNAILRPFTGSASLQSFTLEPSQQAILVRHLFAAAAQQSPNPVTAGALADETFRVGQVLHNNTVGMAIGQMSARLASGSNDVASAIRLREASAGLVANARGDLDNILLGGPFQLDAAVEKIIPHEVDTDKLAQSLMDKIRADMVASANPGHPAAPFVAAPVGADDLARRRRAIAAREALARLELANASLESVDSKLLADYPAYAELASPRPIGIADVQALLDPDEAVAVFITGRNNSLNLPDERTAGFVWLIRRNDSSFRQIKAQGDSLDHMIHLLRDALDTESEQNQDKPGAPFPIGQAHLLYQSLFGPESERLKDVRKLFIVADGALESLPFSTLATAPYNGPATDYAHMPWLGRQMATVSLPSASALRALRRYASKARPAPEPFTGYGDPSLTGPPPIGAAPQPHRDTLIAMRDAHVDVNALRQLPPLPESATELQAMARALEAPAEDVHVQNQATVPAVRSADLSRFRVIAFATHASVGGELTGIAEPAILLTPPPVATEDNDGLLRASMIARDLKLNADWVVLSACNTAAPDGTSGAPGLSGLAKAFFYAGAKALLVSNWSVYSESTSELTTATIREWSAHPEIGRAEALRRAEMQLLDHPSNPEYAHPMFWAPFIVAGEGGANR